jgi:hypothetical protein
MVHRRADPISSSDFVYGVDFIAVKQDAFGKGCFPAVYMCAYSDVPHLSDFRPTVVDAHNLATPKKSLKRDLKRQW